MLFRHSGSVHGTRLMVDKSSIRPSANRISLLLHMSSAQGPALPTSCLYLRMRNQMAENSSLVGNSQPYRHNLSADETTTTGYVASRFFPHLTAFHFNLDTYLDAWGDVDAAPFETSCSYP